MCVEQSRAVFVRKKSANDPAHKCFIWHLKSNEHSEKIVFYDFETFVTADGIYIPYYMSTLTYDGEAWSAWGTDCALNILRHFRKPEYNEYTFISHNARSFDTFFLLKPLIG